MSASVCTCPRDNLCRECLDRSLTWLTGTAAARGHAWATRVAEQRPDLLARPWPALEGRAAAIGAGKVVDLSADQRVLERLLGDLAAAAARRWDELRAMRPRRVTWSLVTAPDERERCCVAIDGARCERSTAYRIAAAGTDEHELELYTYACGEHVELVRGEGDVVVRVER